MSPTLDIVWFTQTSKSIYVNIIMYLSISLIMYLVSLKNISNKHKNQKTLHFASKYGWIDKKE